MSFALKFLKIFSPETAHNLGLQAMRWGLFAPGYRRYKSTFAFNEPLSNPIGLAAGMDKNGYLVNVIGRYGFGFMEVGSVTHLGGIGNPKPRMFRLENDAIMNRMGLNGEPAHDIAKRLSKAAFTNWGVNIAKTHSPDIMGDKAVLDICATYQILKDNGALGFYTVLNISCPNTREGKTFETPESLKELLYGLHQIRNHDIPLLVKLSPTINKTNLERLVAVCNDFNLKGYVVSNTFPHNHPEFGIGGLSGKAVKYHSHLTIKSIRDMHPRYGIISNGHGTTLSGPVIIACGGINHGEDVIDYMESGADLFQAYNGFVSGPNAGPRFAHNVIDELEKYA